MVLQSNFYVSPQTHLTEQNRENYLFINKYGTASSLYSSIIHVVHQAISLFRVNTTIVSDVGFARLVMTCL